MSTFKGFLSHSSLISERLEACNTVLLNNFPQPCKGLLSRFFLLEISEEQRYAATCLFYLFSFDALLQSPVSSSLHPVMDQFLIIMKIMHLLIRKYSSKCAAYTKKGLAFS